MDLTFDHAHIKDAAASFLEKYKDYTVFAFRGEMGAGKTTFISTLCEMLGVEDAMSSPTFSIINEYSSPGGAVYHMDLYRLKDETEAIQAGVEDLLYSGDLCFVEWPERAPAIFPADTAWVELRVVDANTRIIADIQPLSGEHP